MNFFDDIDNDFYFGLYLCTRGKCETIVNDKPCVITEGMVFIKSPLVHIKEIKRSADFNLITIFRDNKIETLAPLAETNFDVVQEILQQNKFYCKCTPEEQSHFLFIKNSLDEHKNNLSSIKKPSKLQKVTTHLIALTEQATILEYARIFLQQQDSGHKGNEKERSIMVKFIFLLFKNYNCHREVRYYANLLNFSPNHFTRIIKKASNRTPSEWIAIITIIQAKKLLRQNNISIKEVAHELSFPEQFTFRKYFKQHTGISPKEYKIEQSQMPQKPVTPKP